MKDTTRPKTTRRKPRAKRKPRVAIIGGVTVELMPVTAKGTLPLSLIKRIVREVKAART